VGHQGMTLHELQEVTDKNNGRAVNLLTCPRRRNQHTPDGNGVCHLAPRENRLIGLQR
jgi:hypothetical protein